MEWPWLQLLSQTYIQAVGEGRTWQTITGFKTVFIIVIVKHVNKLTEC